LGSMKIMAVDFGTRRIGLALADTRLQTVVPLEGFSHRSLDRNIRILGERAVAHDVDRIVVGYPLNMDGSESEMSRRVVNFSRKLEKTLEIRVDLADERLTTFEAREKLNQVPGGCRKMKEKIDSAAAVLILEDYLETLK